MHIIRVIIIVATVTGFLYWQRSFGPLLTEPLVATSAQSNRYSTSLAKEDATNHQITPNTHTARKYLLFYASNGYSNQYFSIIGAIALAARMGRTLVLPPIRPHVTQHPGNLRYTPGPDKNNKCGPQFNTLMKYIHAAAEGVKFPAWSEIYDFNAYSKEFQGFNDWLYSSISFVELSEFAQVASLQSTASGTAWSENVNFICDEFKSSNSKYPDELTSYNSSSQFAFVGSTYRLGAQLIASKTYISLPLEPSQKILDILQRIIRSKDSLLPQDYLGLHFRLDDGYMRFDNSTLCASQEVRDKINFWRSDNEEQVWKHFSDGKAIFLGSSGSRIKECILTIVMIQEEKHQKKAGANQTDVTAPKTAEDKYNNQIVMLQDILDHDTVIMDLINKMQVEVSTAMLALDQFILGLAPEVLMVNLMASFGSTYQIITSLLHEDQYRGYVLKQFGMIVDNN